MKRGALLLLAGGLLAAVAFFLSLTVLANAQDGIFSPSRGLFDDVQSYFQRAASRAGIPAPLWAEYIAGTLIALLEPVGALLLIGGGLLAFKRDRGACALGLSGAVLNLTFQVWFLTLNYAFFIRRGMGTDFGALIQLFGSDYWLAFIGCVLGVIGALVGWREHLAPVGPTAQPPGVSSGRRVLRIRLAALLVLVGGLVVGLDLVIPSDVLIPALQSFVPGQSLLGASKQPIYDLVLWPDLLAILLLLVCGAVTLTGRYQSQHCSDPHRQLGSDPPNTSHQCFQ